jgi:hypothetical protein
VSDEGELVRRRRAQSGKVTYEQPVVIRSGRDTHMELLLQYVPHTTGPPRLAPKFLYWKKGRDGFKRGFPAEFTLNEDEATRLVELLQRGLGTAEHQEGDFIVIPIKDKAAASRIIQNAKSHDLATVIEALLSQEGAVSALAATEPAQVFAATMAHARHNKTLDELEVLLDDSSVTEPQLQSVLEKDWWIFGGRFIDKSKRRSLTVLDEIDVPLIRSDGVLHIIELKKAHVPRLVMAHRNHHIIGPDVNEAVGQAMNYLRSLDSASDGILTTLGINCQRAFATVVIGHPKWVPTIADTIVEKTIRTYNSHLSRIEVITYADLVRDSRNALLLQGDAKSLRHDT